MAKYRFNREAMQVVRDLKEAHGVESEGEVILRALALLKAAEEVVGDDGVLTIQGAPHAEAKSVRVWRAEAG